MLKILVLIMFICLVAIIGYVIKLVKELKEDENNLASAKIKVNELEYAIERYMQEQKTDLEKYLEAQYKFAETKSDKMIYSQLYSLLEGAGITTFKKLRETDLDTLDSIRGIGPKSMEIIKYMKGENVA